MKPPLIANLPHMYHVKSKPCPTYATQNQIFSMRFLGMSAGHLLSSASIEALPVVMSAVAALRHGDLLRIFQNRYRAK